MSRLALTRRAEEGVILRYPGVPPVYVYVSSIRVSGARDDGQVKLVISAPPTVAIDREEVAMDILRERLDALPPVAMSEEECEEVRACASLIESARLVAEIGNGKRKNVAQRLLDRLGGIGRLGRAAQNEAVGLPVATPGAPGIPGTPNPASP
jgi:sRNA-binding carbon storage regulator CsrA